MPCGRVFQVLPVCRVEAVSKHLDALNDLTVAINAEQKELFAKKLQETDQDTIVEIEKRIDELTVEKNNLNGRRVELEKCLQEMQGMHVLAVFEMSDFAKNSPMY